MDFFRNDKRSAGLGNRLLNEGLRYAKDKNASFFDFISLDGHVGKVKIKFYIRKKTYYLDVQKTRF